MQSWIRDLIDLKTQISVLQKCMQQPASSHAAPASHGSVEQALSNKMGGAQLLPWERRTAGATGYGGRASGPKERAMLQP
jgi:hypothetical protein